MTQSPLQIVKERFKDKAGLVSAVQALATDDLWNDRRLDTDKGLDSVSNKKLLHLHDVLSRVQKEFGSRAKLIDALATAQGRAKDADYKKGLERHSTPRLLERYTVAQRAAKRK
jgi:hypothetical protein